MERNKEMSPNEKNSMYIEELEKEWNELEAQGASRQIRPINWPPTAP